MEGDHGFAFVIDTSRPDYGAWWRHGSTEQAFIEEPLPAKSVKYAIELTSSGYVIEAKIDLKKLGIPLPKEGDEYGLMIVHCDPDGGEYGGHFLIYGKGDLDTTWSPATLTGPQTPVERKVK